MTSKPAFSAASREVSRPKPGGPCAGGERRLQIATGVAKRCVGGVERGARGERRFPVAHHREARGPRGMTRWSRRGRPPRRRPRAGSGCLEGAASPKRSANHSGRCGVPWWPRRSEAGKEPRVATRFRGGSPRRPRLEVTLRIGKTKDTEGAAPHIEPEGEMREAPFVHGAHSTDRSQREREPKDPNAERMSEMSASVRPNIPYKRPAPEAMSTVDRNRAPLTSNLAETGREGGGRLAASHRRPPFRPCTMQPKPSRRTTKSGLASHVVSEHLRHLASCKLPSPEGGWHATYLSHNRHTANPGE